MKTFVLTCCLILAVVGAHAQGSLTYQPSSGFGGRLVVLGCDGQRVSGSGYTAELWFSPIDGATENSLVPVPGSQVSLASPDGPGKSKLDLPGTYGGDRVTLQLRIWNNENGGVSSWAAATEKGKSNLFIHELAGIDRAGSPKLGTGSIVGALQSPIQLYCVPEPSIIALGAIGFAWLMGSQPRRYKSNRSPLV